MKPTMEIIEISDNMIMTSGTGISCFPDSSCATDTNTCFNDCLAHACPDACPDREDSIVGS